MKKTLVAVLMVVSGAALAEPQERVQPQEQAERRRQREQRHRMMQVVGLTEVLGLSTQEALKLSETLRQFDERRRPLKEQVRTSGRLLKDAARGDAAALGQVDQAIGQILDARIQLATLDKELFQALGRDLSPQQRAKLAIFYAKFRGMKGARMMRDMDRDGHEGRFQQRRMRRGQRMGQAEPHGAPGLLAEGDAEGFGGGERL